MTGDIRSSKEVVLDNFGYPNTSTVKDLAESNPRGEQGIYEGLLKSELEELSEIAITEHNTLGLSALTSLVKQIRNNALMAAEGKYRDSELGTFGQGKLFDALDKIFSDERTDKNVISSAFSWGEDTSKFDFRHGILKTLQRIKEDADLYVGKGNVTTDKLYGDLKIRMVSAIKLAEPRSPYVGSNPEVKRWLGEET